MIVISVSDRAFASELANRLIAAGVSSDWISPTDPKGVARMYESDVSGVVVEPVSPVLGREAWHDLLASLGRRIPVVVVGSESVRASADPGAPASEGDRLPDTVSWLDGVNAEEVSNTLDSSGAIGIDRRDARAKGVSLYNSQTPVNLLQRNGFLSLLHIDTSYLRRFRMELGSEVYFRLQECVHRVLFGLWGPGGTFRGSDILCRRSAHSSVYYVFLERARSGSGIPVPGSLEKLTDRLAIRLQNSMWRELQLEKSRGRLPSTIREVPEFSVGYASSLFNPCIDSAELVETLTESAAGVGHLQLDRMRTRRRELMQSIMHAEDLLHPNYQAVFQAQPLTREMVDMAQQSKSIRPLADHIYGFESLIRVRKDWVGVRLSGDAHPFIDPAHLFPDVLFSLAAASDVALELDQACLRHAAAGARQLPGKLLVNILPRNLYYIEKLHHIFANRPNVVFEVAESEAINNIDLMLRVRDHLSKVNMEISVDDLGKGYAGLERIIQIKPDLIKFDRSLIENIHNDEAKKAFVRGLVDAAKLSGALVLAEGVEKWEELAYLQQIGIDLVQGFLTHRPQAVDLILKDLDEPRRLSVVA